MANVFLSYARDDVKRATTLARMLVRAGFSVWWDRNIEGGNEYAREIEDALRDADSVVVLWSVHSIGSPWVRDEAASGRDTNRLVPVRLDGAEPPLGFRQFQTIDLSRWKGREGPALSALTSALSAKVGREVASEPAGTSVLSHRPRRQSRPLLLFACLGLIAAALTYFVLVNLASAAPTTIAIVATSSGADPFQSAALARSMTIELGATQASQGSAFELREISGQENDDVDYLVQIAASGPGATVSADISLFATEKRQILWTSHLQEAASQQPTLGPHLAARLEPVLACLSEARDAGGQKLKDPVLKLYLRGCEKFADAIPGLVDQDQLSLLRQVVAQAPSFAPAIAHLALIEADGDHVDAARALIAKAKALDPKLPKIYLAKLELLPRSKWRERQAALAQGLAVNPDAAPLRAGMAFELSQVGRLNDGIASARRAVELDPSSPVIRSTLIQILTHAGRTSEAKTELERAEKIWPTSATLRDGQYAFDLRVGDPARALSMLRQDRSLATFALSKTTVPDAGIEAFLQARINPTPENIDKAINAHIAHVRQEPGEFGPLLIALAIFNRTDEAYALVSSPKALSVLPAASELMFRSYFNAFRRDPRFLPLANRIGLVRFWRETGRWPDFCFEPDLPYDCKKELASSDAPRPPR